jgi:hypothetical protein
LTLASIPSGATIHYAALYAINYFATVNPSATFSEQSLGAPVVDTSAAGGLSTYKWNVPTNLITGNGSYSASAAGLSNNYGLALVVVFSHSSLPEGRVIVKDGATDLNGLGSGEGSAGSPNTASTTFTVPTAGAGTLWIHTGADNNGGVQTGEVISFNGTNIGGPIDANLGPFASLFKFSPVPVVAGTNTAQVSAVSGDQFGWDIAVLSVVAAIPKNIATLVGTGVAGFNGDGVIDGPPADGIPDRQVNYPDGGVALDQNGNVIFADTNNHRVRRIITSGPAMGTIETIAGTGVSGFNSDLDENGNRRLATAALLSGPTGVAVNHSTGDIYVVDSLNHRVVEIAGPTGLIRTVAGSPTSPTAGFVDQAPAADARFDQPLRVVVNGNTLIVSDPGNGRIRRVNLVSQTVDTIAGIDFLGLAGDGGPATSARFGAPIGIALDLVGRIIVADKLNNRVRRFTIGGSIETIAGSGVVPDSGAGLGGFGGDGGPATSALLDSPVDVSVDQAGNILVADQANNRVRRIDATTAIITTFAGGGTTFNSPSGVAARPGGAVVIDTQGQKVRAILPVIE